MNPTHSWLPNPLPSFCFTFKEKSLCFLQASPYVLTVKHLSAKLSCSDVGEVSKSAVDDDKAVLETDRKLSGEI